MDNLRESAQKAAMAFVLQGEVIDVSRYGSGHINDTFLLLCRDGEKEFKYILQRMNHDVFKDIEGLIHNVKGVTTFLRRRIIENHGDPDR